MTASSLFDTDERQDDPTGASPVTAPSSAPSASLYRKYRPNSFGPDEMVGQDHVVKTLRNAIALDRVAHAYLFSGPRGTGKTTTARLLAKAVNCLDPDPARRPCNACPNCQAINAGSSPDIIEIDAASNRGIDDIRDLRERIRYAPTQLPSKVYIIDEAHQITGAAANAFLKTLEEPPAHSRFILATTDPEELLPTIVSRCQRYEFRRISASDMERRLRTVADLEAIPVTDGALSLIARHATGSLRDALGLLEQLALLASAPGSEGKESGPIDVDDVRGALGLSHNDRVEGLARALAEHDAGAGLRLIQDAIDEGEDPRQLNRQLVAYLRLLLLERSGADTQADERAREIAGQFSLQALATHARRFSEIDFTIKHAPFPQLPLEVAMVEATAVEDTRIVTEPAAAIESSPRPAPGASRPTSLRDRVRNTQPIQETPHDKLPVPRQERAPITPLRPEPTPEPAPAAEPPLPGNASIDVAYIADLWPSVRADVKALNRRIEALLSEVDPVAISGNQITLAVPYPFHRDKLNSDDVRETVAGVLSRLLGREISLLCILRGEMQAPVSAAPRTASDAHETPSSAPPVDQAPDEDERIESRMRAAKNIFDAEEIEPDEVFSARQEAEGR